MSLLARRPADARWEVFSQVAISAESLLET
jgi:hypothetical protein